MQNSQPNPHNEIIKNKPITSTLNQMKISFDNLNKPSKDNSYNISNPPITSKLLHRPIPLISTPNIDNECLNIMEPNHDLELSDE